MQRKKVFVLHGIDADGYRDILGLWSIGCENRMSWLHILEELKSRGVESAAFFRIDRLKGFESAAVAI